jgi:predicted ATPase/DNA-binding winged helix-turn-helix (wHTH) protein
VSDGISTTQDISFGPFRLIPSQHLLLENGIPVQIGSRALQILIALTERPNRLISKEDLISRVWPETFVEEGNLRVHIAALRRALGDGQSGNRYVVNIPGRGYRFVAPVAQSVASEAGPANSSLAEQIHNLPPAPARILGRGGVIDFIQSQLPQKRFISLVGPGGIGKTTVAVAAAKRLLDAYSDGVRFVDLSPLSDPQLVASALAFVLGLAVRSDNPVPGLIAFLQNKKMLLVLDSCEHVIDATASLIEQIIRGAPGIHILVTSREALRANREFVQRLGPLAVPPVSTNQKSSEALTYPAVQLFIERVTDCIDLFELTDADVFAIADLCRRLDGIALAIELAASRVDTFGVRGLAAHLDDRFRLLRRGRRTAIPRHQTLSAMVDWSYEFLSESERMLLRRLSVFAGSFSLDAVKAIATGPGINAGQVATCLADLVAKSLVVADVHGPLVQYRLLESMRAYGFGKLKEAGEASEFGRRHVSYFLHLFEHADWSACPTDKLLTAYGGQIDNVRAALDWAFSSDGDTALGVALTIAAVPLWTLLSLMEECRARAQTALTSLKVTPRGTPEAMKLLTALGATLRFKKSSVDEVEVIWTKALEMAESFGDADYQLRALCGLWIVRFSGAHFRAALTIAKKFKEVAAGAADRNDSLIGDRMIGFALHFLGEQTEARHHIENMIHNFGASVGPVHIIRFGYDQRSTAHNTLAEIFWLTGHPDQAMRITRENVQYIQSVHHELSLCNGLHGACPIALLTGDLSTAQQWVTMLLDHSTEHALPLWNAAGRCFEGVLLIRQGNTIAGINMLRAGLDELLETRFVVRYLTFLGELAAAYAHLGEIARAHAAIDDALERCRTYEEFWYRPELLRIKGEILLRDGAVNSPETAERHFRQSIDLARQHKALSWELRTAISLARLWRGQGRLADARQEVSSVYTKFTEGFGTTDLQSAKRFLDEMRQS